MFIASVYHPWKQDEYQVFNTELQKLLGWVPNAAEVVLNQNINANVGIEDGEELESGLGPFGFNNRN